MASADHGPFLNPVVSQLRHAYQESGLTMEQIAARAEVNYGTVQRALAGKPINMATLLRLCVVLKRTVKIDAA